MTYVDRTNLKYRRGNCILVANLQIFDIRHKLLSSEVVWFHLGSLSIPIWNQLIFLKAHYVDLMNIRATVKKDRYVKNKVIML